MQLRAETMATDCSASIGDARQDTTIGTGARTLASNVYQQDGSEMMTYI